MGFDMLGSQSFLGSDSSDSLDTIENPELNRRLGLYQLFLKLYEQRRDLLDEILDLENSGNRGLTSQFPYIQGVVFNQQIHLVTNLLEGKTQALAQPQGIWTIGRDPRQVMISIPDRRLSRCHAAIQYCGDQTFQLIDLNSSNGSFINGEVVRRIASLKDGDQIRLGSLTFRFFGCYVEQHLGDVAPELLAQINEIRLLNATEGDRSSSVLSASIDSGERMNKAVVCPPGDTLMFMRNNQQNLL